MKTKFGLTECPLEEVLSELNQTKCIPPLSDSEVKTIAKSVDRSNAPIGESNVEHNGKNSRKTLKQKQRIMPVVSANVHPISVESLLSKSVSFYKDFWAKKPSSTTTIGQFLDDCKNGTYKEQVDVVRVEENKTKRDELKKALPCITPHVNPAEGKTKDACEQAGRNGIITIDRDNVPEGELESEKAKIAEHPSVFAVVTSASGKGLVAFAAYEGTPDWDTMLAAFQFEFPDYKIDMNCKGVYRLRFTSYDSALIVKSGDVYPAVLIERTITPPQSVTPIVLCGVDVLDNILERIEPIDWVEFETTLPGGGVKPPHERDYLLRTCEQILGTADTEKTPLVHHESRIYYYCGTHYEPINETNLKTFLIEAAVRCDVPPDIAVYQTFAEKIVKQFYINSTRHNSGVSEPDTPHINLKNGTLFFDKNGHRFEGHSSQRFIRYCLNFEYDQSATAPLWQKHLDRSLPIPEKQQYLAKCLALPFYRGKIEKAPVLCGERDTGKSTTLDISRALYGKDNITSESLTSLTKSDYTGDFARARLDGKLVNIASDVSAKLNDEGITKMLISREEISARHPYGDGFDMRNYARLIFAMNTLPPQFFTDPALTKRVAIIEFDQRISTQDIDTDFAGKVIASELPGILNWIISGLERLLQTGRLDPPQCCIEEMERMRKENDPVSAWLDDQGYYPGNSESRAVKYVYPIFVEYCKDNGNQVLSTKTFTKRLRNQGYEVFAPNNHVGIKLFYTTINPNSHPHVSPDTENRGETGEHTGSNSASLPDGSPVVPSFDATKQGVGNDGNNGNDIWEQVFIDLDEDDSSDDPF